ALFGFQVSPEGNLTLNSITIGFTGSATNADISNLRIAVDNNSNGVFDGGDAVISGAGKNLAASVVFSSLSGAAFSSAPNYLLIGDVNASATTGATLTAGINTATDYSSNAAKQTG